MRDKRKDLNWVDDGTTSRRFGQLLQQLGIDLPARDQAMVGSLTSLYTRCAYIREVVDDLLATSSKMDDRRLVRKKIGTLWAEVDNLNHVTRQMVGPLDRLHTSLLDRRPRVKDDRKR